MLDLRREPALLLHILLVGGYAIVLLGAWVVHRRRGAVEEEGLRAPLLAPTTSPSSESEVVDDEAGEAKGWVLRRRVRAWPRQLLLALLIIVLVAGGVWSLERRGRRAEGGVRLVEALYWLLVYGLEDASLSANRANLALLVPSYAGGAALFAALCTWQHEQLSVGQMVAVIVPCALACGLVCIEAIKALLSVRRASHYDAVLEEGAEQPVDGVLYRRLQVKPTPEQKASLLSTCLFWWMEPILSLGKRRVLDLSDLYHLEEQDLAQHVWEQFAPHVSLLQRRYATSAPSSSSRMVGSGLLLAWALVASWPVMFYMQGAYLLVSTVLQFGVPLSLKYLVGFITNYHKGDDVPTLAVLAAAVLFLAPCLAAICNGQQFQIARRLIFRYRAAVVSAIYRQTLRLDILVASSGQVTNLCSVDANSADAGRYIHNLWSTALQIVIASALLFWVLGRWESGVVGVAFIVVSIPLTGSVSRRLQAAQRAFMRRKDTRLSLLGEVLQGIRVIKLLAWERDFLAKLESARQSELLSLGLYVLYNGLISLIWLATPILVGLATFLLHTQALHATLTASQGFTALALFGLLRDPLSKLSTILNSVVKAQVSFGRIERFLLRADLLERFEGRLLTEGVGIEDHDTTMAASSSSLARGEIRVQAGTFYWSVGRGGGGRRSSEAVTTEDESAAVPAVVDVELSVPPGHLVCVYGPTGCGKSALLLAMLGELRGAPQSRVGVRGRVAYASQKAWIQNGTVRDNIVFGQPFDERRYREVIEACALGPDLELLSCGDMTEIGEKGVNLSGGQQQRLSLARAVYSDADVYLLDDVLSAVDAHVASHLLTRCLTGPLMAGKTRVLVTHAPALTLAVADHAVLVGPGGRIVAQGCPRSSPGYTPPEALLTFAARHQRAAQEAEVEEEEGEQKQGGGQPEEDDERDEASAAAKGGTIKAPASTTPAPSAGPGKLISAEKRAKGRVKAAVYWAYIKAAGGPVLVLPALLSFFAVEALQYMQNRALGNWVSSISSSSSNDWHASLGYVGYSVAALAVVVFRVILTSLCSLTASRIIHGDMIRRVLRAPLHWFETTPLGRIQNRFSMDVETIDQDVMDSLSTFLETLVSILAVTLVIIINMAPLALGMLPILAASLWVGYSYQCTSRELKRLESTTRSPIYSHFSETVVGVPTVRAFGRQQAFIHESYVRINRNDRVYQHLWSANRWLAVRLQLLGATITGMVGAYIMTTLGKVEGPVAGLVLLYSMNFADAMNTLIRSQAEMEMDMNSVERAAVEYCHDIDQEAVAVIPSRRPASATWPSEGELVVEHLSMRYPSSDRDVISDLSFRIPPRTRVGVVGRTGAGKSTLTSAFFRLVEPGQGSAVRIDGHDILSMGLEDLRSHLAIVPQEPTLFRGTIRSNLDPFNEFEDWQVWAALDKAQLARTVVTSLDQPVSEAGNNLSVGQRALVCMARALLRMKAVLFLDEATANVDPDTDAIIQGMVRKHLKDCTVVSVAHRLHTVAFYDLVMVMDRGRLVELDTPLRLLSKEPPGVFRSMAEKTGDYEVLLKLAKEAEH